MKERPIIFSTPMVLAILDGRKTQTRRIMKVQPDSRGTRCTNVHFEDWHGKQLKCPYGWVGDILWVRETWVMHNRSKYRFYLTYQSGDLWIKYKADGVENYETGEKILWKPSIFMPKHVCRIKLEITDIRVEKLCDITEKDAMAEGIKEVILSRVKYVNGDKTWTDYSSDYWFTNPIESYRTLWESINGKGSWEKNPWVWCISFKRL